MLPALSRQLRVDLVDVPSVSPIMFHRLFVVLVVHPSSGSHRPKSIEHAGPTVTAGAPPTVPSLPFLARVLLEPEPPLPRQDGSANQSESSPSAEFFCRDPGALPLAERLRVRQPVHFVEIKVLRVIRNPTGVSAADVPRVVRHGFKPAHIAVFLPERLVRGGISPFTAHPSRYTQIQRGQMGEHLAQEVPGREQTRLGFFGLLPFTRRGHVKRVKENEVC